MRQGHYKLIRFHEDRRLELYDLKEDPGEQRNLASAVPDKRDELAALLARWLDSVRARMPERNPNYDAKRESEGYWWKEPNAFEKWRATPTR